MTNYNGWANKATWNISLWINNDEPIYREAVKFMESYKGRRPYVDFIKHIGLTQARTPDNFKFMGYSLNLKELNEMMKELVA